MNILNKILNVDYESSHQNATLNKSAHHALLDNAANLVIQLTNCRLVRGGQLVRDDLWIRGGLILDPLRLFYDEKRQADLQLDCDGLIIAPGFIDLQLNGAFGRDFTNDPDIEECVTSVSRQLLRYGVTAYCPTIVSSQASVYANTLPKIRRSTTATGGGSGGGGAQVLGVHLEGPFISRQKPGAHDMSALRSLEAPSGLAALEATYGMPVEKLRDVVSIVTLAPELDPHGECITALAAHGIIVSIGHSEANLAQGEAAVRHGARFITHLFNAMLPFHHRDPHLIGLLSDRSLVHSEQLSATKSIIYYGIIADNIHTHPSALNIAYKAHPDGLVLVTDAISAMGLAEGRVHRVGEQLVEIVCEQSAELGGIRSAYLQGTRTLCGSVATIDDCVRNLMSATECTLVEACLCASEHPARLLGVYPCKGSLEYGAHADFVIIDERVNVRATFVGGDLAWSAADWSPLFKIKLIP